MKALDSSLYTSVEFSRVFLILLSILDLLINDVCYASQADVDRQLEMGKKLLAAGQLADALSHFTAAIDGDPTNYMAYYRRATVNLGLGKTKTALPDLDKTIELKPDFYNARVQRGNIYLKQGQLAKARADYKHVSEMDPSNPDGRGGLNNVQVLAEETENAKDRLSNYDYNAAVTHLSRAIDLSPMNADLRELRADCYEQIGERYKAVGDLRSVVRLTSDNTKAILRVSLMLYDMGDAEQSLSEIRECLRLDPDHKTCFKHYKKVKKLVKQMSAAQQASNENNVEACLAKSQAMRKTEPNVVAYATRADAFVCHCLANTDQATEALDACSRVIEREPSNLDAICDRADAHISLEQYQEAIRDFQAAMDVDRNFQRAKEGIKKAQKLLKNSKRRDYYKILGVSRHATKREIMRAFRKKAAKMHPDHYKGDDKKKAEKNFLDLNDAKEVLTDAEKRRSFDDGNDPLDPEAQQGGRGNPFWQAFNQFGQGGFTFKFHF